MNIEILTEKDFKAELPEDFEHLISVKKVASGLQWDNLDYFPTPGKLRRFHIRENIIYFTGSFSKWWVIRIFQETWSYLFPEHYELKYVRVRIPRDKNAWKKEVAKAVVEYGKTPHTDKKLQEYKDRLNS